MDKDTMDRMSAALDNQLLRALEHGTPALKGGEPIIINGKNGPEPLMVPPSASILNVARQRLAGAGPDEQTRPGDMAERMKRAREQMRGKQLPPVDDDPEDGI